MSSSLTPFQLIPEYRAYVWGGQRLRPGQLTAEAWVVHEEDRIASGPFQNQLLGEVAARFGARLLGEAAHRRCAALAAANGPRFPLLIKILDCAQWLSLQVHPNDEQAVRLEGPGMVGKTEAWHVLDHEPNAQLIAGIRPGIDSQALTAAVKNGKALLDQVQTIEVNDGDTILMNAGTIHALGPGMLVYEVQQSSNLTYRVYDWDRPQTPERGLHIDKTLAVANPSARSEALPLPVTNEGQLVDLTACEYFTLQTLAAAERPVTLDTHGLSFHALTVVAGALDLTCAGETIHLNRYETAIVPAECGAYQVHPAPAFRLLLSSAS